MQFIRYTGLTAYHNAVIDLLAREEVANNLPIGILLRGLEGDEKPAGWLMAAVADENGAPLLAALRTPLFNLLLAGDKNSVPDSALACLAAGLRAEDPRPPGVTAEQTLARRFARLWAGDAWHTHLRMRVMRLDAPPAPQSAPGRPRPLAEADLHFAPYWEVAFARDCRVHVPTLEEAHTHSKARVRQGTHLLWLDEDGTPVSQAAQGRSTRHGAIISHVYTPPWYRGRGYAAACVAALCGRLLAEGNHYCALFADAANPTSCGIYHRLGFRDVCINDELRFAAGG